MKKLIQLLVFAALLMTFALPALAQTTPANNSGSASSAQDDTEAKAKLYDQFRTNIKDHPDVAYQAGKDYLAKYEAKDGPDDQYVKYIKKWVTSYEKIARRQQLVDQLTNKQLDAAFASAPTVLADYPDDLGILFDLARAGTIASTSGNSAHDADTINYTRKTIQLIQSGKSFDPSKPLTEKEKNEMLGNLNFALGLLLKKNSPTEAITYFVNAAQVEGPAKSNPLTYYNLADIYETNQYVNLAKQFNDTCKTEEQAKTQACIDLKAKADLVVDHIIDALARAIAYSNTGADKASFDKARAAWTESITNYYKYRNNGSTTGLNELIAGITSKPFPKPGEAIVPPMFQTTAPTTPSSGATTTPGTSTTGASTTTTAPKTTTTPATNTKTTNSTSTPSKTTTQPTGKTSTSKSTPRRAH
ncbi:MAG: hypothetical protein DMF68_17290 [Acidobacteria bacterium]|nr:MAG: hypothetical protein DMF68_17290 [Acidobacteriota bacterium]